MAIQEFKDLMIWQKGMEIVQRTFELKVPDDGNGFHGWSERIKETAVSIPVTIAQGFVRRPWGVYKEFLSRALGACAALETQCVLLTQRQDVDQLQVQRIKEDLHHEVRMLYGLLKKLHANGQGYPQKKEGPPTARAPQN